eukprot:ctg_433.g254
MADTQTSADLPASTISPAERDGGDGYDGHSSGRDVDSTVTETYESFDDMGLRDELLRGIYAYGFEKPSAIQQRGIVPMVKGRDMLAQSQSGTGKTGCFVIGMLQNVDTTMRKVQGLILAPTRELAQQIEKVAIALGDYLGVKVHSHAARHRGHARPSVRYDPTARAGHHHHQEFRAGRGRRDAVARLQGADLHGVPVHAGQLPGDAVQRHHAGGDSGDVRKVSAGTRAHPGAQRRTHAAGHQTVLRCHRAGGVEAGDAHRPVRDHLRLPDGGVCEQPPQGRVAQRADARTRLYRVGHPRGYVARRAQPDHERVPLGIVARAHHHRPAGARHRRAAGEPGDQLRPAQQPRELHPPRRPLRPLRPQGRRHQLSHGRRRAHAAGDRILLQLRDTGDARGHQRHVVDARTLGWHW